MKNDSTQPKRKKAALYNPYLDTMGGGERHILSILKVLEDDGYDLHIFWDTDLTDKLGSKLDLQFSHLKFVPNIFNKSGSLKKITQLGQYDAFFYVSDGSYFFSGAKKNYIFCMIPQKNLYPQSFINHLKTYNYHFISNSRYTQSWLKKWGINSKVIYPYIDSKYFSVDLIQPRQKYILSVGRFFKHLHSKRQDMIIESFKVLKAQHPEFTEYKLILAGSAHAEDVDYVDELNKKIGTDTSIELRVNIPFTELFQLYAQSQFYWHFTGYEIDEDKHPEQVEHLGITPLEAMATGNITFCYNAGGPKELIVDNANGFLFNSQTELREKMRQVWADQDLQKTIQQNARQFVHEQFSYEIFKANVLKNL